MKNKKKSERKFTLTNVKNFWFSNFYLANLVLAFIFFVLLDVLNIDQLDEVIPNYPSFYFYFRMFGLLLCVLVLALFAASEIYMRHLIRNKGKQKNYLPHSSALTTKFYKVYDSLGEHFSLIGLYFVYLTMATFAVFMKLPAPVN